MQDRFKLNRQWARKCLLPILLLTAILPAWGGSDLGGSFALTNQNGQEVTEADYLGKPVLMYFGFANCGDVCPTDLARMGFVAKKLAATKSIEVTPIFVSIDPERDTPEVLSVYVPSFHPDLVGLTGSAEAIADIADKYAVYYKPVPMGSGYMMDHSTIMFLLDAKGDYLAHYTREATVDDLVQQISNQLGAP